MEMPPGPPPPGPPPRPGPVGPAPHDGAAPIGGRLLSDEAANRRLVATTAALALVAVALMIGVFLWTRDGGDEAAPTFPPVTAPDSTEPNATIVPADDGTIEEVLAELQAFVEEHRDLAFREDIDVVLLDDDAYAARAQADFEADLDETRDDLVSSTAALQAIGLWPPDTDPVTV